MKKNLIILVLAAIVVLLGFVAYRYHLQAPQKPAGNQETAPQESLISTAKEVVDALANKDYAKLQSLTSDAGLSLAMYPQLDLSKINVAKSDVSKIPTDQRTQLFGYTDGKGDPVILTASQFFDKRIYTVDYRNAPEIAANKKLGGGNSAFTLPQDIQGREFVGFYFPGFKPEYQGMDWTTLYLIFDKVGNDYKLRAIAKDNWTI
jgi:hypothetical protein